MKEKELRNLMEQLDRESQKAGNQPAVKPPNNLYSSNEISDEDIEAVIAAATEAFRKRLNAE